MRRRSDRPSGCRVSEEEGDSDSFTPSRDKLNREKTLFHSVFVSLLCNEMPISDAMTCLNILDWNNELANCQCPPVSHNAQ